MPNPITEADALPTPPVSRLETTLMLIGAFVFSFAAVAVFGGLR